MNKNQRLALLVAGCLVLLSLLFPPFRGNYYGRAMHGGFHFLFFRPDGSLAVNASLLFVEWVGIGLLFAIAFKLLEGVD